MTTKHVAILVGLLAIALAGPLVGQNGDYLIYDSFGSVRRAPRGQGPLPGTPLPARIHSAWASTAADDTFFLSGVGPNGNVHILAFAGGAVNTVATFTKQGVIYGMDIDDAGDLRFVWNDNSNGYILTAPIGTPLFTTLFVWPSQLLWPYAYVEDHGTGDLFLTATSARSYFRLDPVRGIVTSMIPAPPGGLFFSDPDSGDLIIGIRGSVARFDVSTGVTRTLYSPPAGVGAWVADVAFDQATRNWIVSGFHISGRTFFGFYGMIDPGGTVVSLNAPLIPFSSFDRIEVEHGRVFMPLTPPVRGQDYRVRLRAHDQPGVAYQAAFAFSHTPGIVTAAGTIPLTLDPLFVASVTGGPSFRNLGGFLDANGSAVLEFRIRVSPVGFRLHLAAVTYDRAGIRSILGPHSFTVR